MSKYTPGEWAVRYGTLRTTLVVAPPTEQYPLDRVIARVETAREEWPVNARLLAAAPKLVDQLEETQRVLAKLMVTLHERLQLEPLTEVQVLFDNNQRLLGPLR